MDETIKFLKTIFGSTADAALGAFVAIIVFILGYIVNGLIGLAKTFLSRKIVRLQVELQLSDLHFSLDRQSNLFLTYKESLILGHPDYGRFKITTVPSVNILSQIGYEKVFEAFFSGFKTLIFPSKDSKNRAFLLVWEAVNYLQNFHSEALKDFKDLDSRHSLIMTSFEDMFQRHLNLVGGIMLMSELEKDKDIKAYYDGIYKIHMDFIDKGDVKNRNVIKQNLLKPLYRLKDSHILSMSKIMLGNGINDFHLATASLDQHYKDLADNLNASKDFAEISMHRYKHLSNNISDSYKIFFNKNPRNLLVDTGLIDVA